MNEAHSKRIDNESGSNKMKLLYVPCFSLNTILKAINVNKVDYFSLDVEGGEYDVLKSINFKKTIIDSFSIEYNGFLDAKKSVTSHLETNGYINVKTDPQDVYFTKNVSAVL